MASLGRYLGLYDREQIRRCRDEGIPQGSNNPRAERPSSIGLVPFARPQKEIVVLCPGGGTIFGSRQRPEFFGRIQSWPADTLPETWPPLMAALTPRIKGTGLGKREINVKVADLYPLVVGCLLLCCLPFLPDGIVGQTFEFPFGCFVHGVVRVVGPAQI